MKMYLILIGPSHCSTPGGRGEGFWELSITAQAVPPLTSLISRPTVELASVS